MESNHKKGVVIFIAPPGGGKGTQAEMFEEKFGFFHLETSMVLEDRFNNGDQSDPRVKEAKQQWLSGELINPETVVMWLIDKIKDLARQGKSIVFSGSPRTLYEAEKELPLLEELYGKENIKIFHISISDEESVRRNSHRRICKAERHPIPYTAKYKDIKKCPIDGSEIVKRALDKPEVIKERLVEYKTRTEPVIEYMRLRGYDVVDINGEQHIDEVSDDILKHMRL